MRRRKYVAIVLLMAMTLTGCSQIEKLGVKLQNTTEQNQREEPQEDSVLSSSIVGTIPGRAILDHSPKAVVEESEENDEMEEADGTEEALEDNNGVEDLDSEDEELENSEEEKNTEKEPSDESDEPEEEETTNIEIITTQLGSKSIEQLISVKDYLVDYENEGAWVREVLWEKGDRYIHEMEDTNPTEEMLYQARMYFQYMTEINDYLGDISGFDEENTEFTLKYAKKYSGTKNTVFYFREYVPKTLMTTGNEAQIVMDEDGRLIHYLSFGGRNPNVLEYEPRYSEEQVEKLMWQSLTNKKYSGTLIGYADDYELEDLYLKIPTSGDYTKMRKEFRPQWYGKFVSDDASYILTILDYRK